ncbi:MAG: hypothetical protein ACPGLV_00975 [Bacteroidia bacterium]
MFRVGIQIAIMLKLRYMANQTTFLVNDRNFSLDAGQGVTVIYKIDNPQDA